MEEVTSCRGGKSSRPETLAVLTQVCVQGWPPAGVCALGVRRPSLFSERKGLVSALLV